MPDTVIRHRTGALYRHVPSPPDINHRRGEIEPGTLVRIVQPPGVIGTGRNGNLTLRDRGDFCWIEDALTGAPLGICFRDSLQPLRKDAP